MNKFHAQLYLASLFVVLYRLRVAFNTFISFTTLQLMLVPYDGRRTSPTFFTIALIILYLLLDHCVFFDNGILLMYTLKGASSVANLFTAYEDFQ